MRLHLTTALALLLAFASVALAAVPIELELATERGVQITAPREWLQLLAEIGVTNVRIRTATGADKPLADNRGTAEEPRFHVVGVLNSRNELQLPGGTFGPSDRQQLSDFFARLSAEGPESLTAERGRFGLTAKEFAALHAELAQPLGLTTKGRTLAKLLDQVQRRFGHRLRPDAAADRLLRAAGPIEEEAGNLTAGTGVAILLNNAGLALRPEKAPGGPVELAIVPLGAADDVWPIGWESQISPRETAPALFEFLNVEIEGYSLQEAVDAIAPRLKLPIFWNRAALAKYKIDPTKLQVHIPKTRTFYKRILDRALAQSHLAAQLRVDEAGTAFLWIMR
ncbi:MAG: hypothetical protein AB7G28_05610 [Pirellulales bacterium]